MRNEARDQLGQAVSDEQFDAQFAPWEKLSPAVRTTKITIARDELLRVLDKAGYAVVRKRKEN